MSQMSQINNILLTHTVLPVDVCTIILHYANTTIKKINHDCYKYNNDSYYIKNDAVYHNNVYIEDYARSFIVATINGTDCLIVEDDNIFTIRNLANNQILTTYKYSSFLIGVWYHKNRIYFSVDTSELDDDPTYAVVILEIDCMFNIAVKDHDICGTVEYTDDNMIIAKYNYMLHIYTIDLVSICTIDIGQLSCLGWIIKHDNVLYYCASDNKYSIDIENKQIVI